MDLPSRLARLPPAAGLAGVAEGHDVRRATGVRARLLGLALLRAIPPRAGLLIPRARSVHTFAMRFELDLLWLDAHGRVVRFDERVPPRRVRSCRAARAVIELPATASSTPRPRAPSPRSSR